MIITKTLKRRIRLYSFDEAHRTDAKTYQIILIILILILC